MNKKHDNNDKRPTSRNLSSFVDSEASDGGFSGEGTIPGDYAIPEHTEHDLATGPNYPGGLADMIDPSLDPSFDGQTLDNELPPEFTQTDLGALPNPDPEEQSAHEEMHALLMDNIAFLDALADAEAAIRKRSLDTLAPAELERLRTRFLGSLRSYGVREEKSTGARLDPELQEVAREQPVLAKDRDGVVISVERPGYTRNGHPLRLARVVVGKKS